MKIIAILFAVLAVSCKSQKKENSNPAPISFQDTVQLVPHQKGWYYEVSDPYDSKVKVLISNNTDSTKIFVISIKELVK
jgi:hypothetical protein